MAMIVLEHVYNHKWMYWLAAAGVASLGILANKIHDVNKEYNALYKDAIACVQETKSHPVSGPEFVDTVCSRLEDKVCREPLSIKQLTRFYDISGCE